MSSCGLVAAALVASQLMMATTGVDGFSVSARRTGASTSTLASPSPRSTATTMMSPISSIHTPTSLVIAYGSLRDLIESSGDNNNNNERDSNDDPSDQDLLNHSRSITYSRSKFSDTKFRSRSIYGTGGSDFDDERGLHVDRLSTFSFASAGKAPRSGSEGGHDEELQVEERDLEEEKMSEEIAFASLDDDDDDDVEDVQDDISDDGESKAPDNNNNNNDGIADININRDYRGGTGSMLADRGIKYSKSSFPTRKVKEISDESDSLGMHEDRLSTFSFSSKSPMLTARSTQSAPAQDAVEEQRASAEKAPPAKYEIDESSFGVDNFHSSINLKTNREAPLYNRPGPAASPDGLDNHFDRLSTFSLASDKVEKEEEGEDEKKQQQPSLEQQSQRPAPVVKYEIDEASFGVDNFHSSINIKTSRSAAPSNSADPSASPDGLDNHFDRLSTYSISKTKNGPLPSADATGGSAASSSGGSSGPSFDNANYDNRLGTFSFASADSQTGGSTTSMASSGVSPLLSSPSTSESNANVEQQPPKVNSDISERARSSEPNDSHINKPMSADEVYSHPQKGSLSSLASSVSTVTRNDRINRIKEKTDPKLLHPDGMNVPRLNSKGEVMSMSKTSGKMNIFQRIEAAAGQEGGGEEKDDAEITDGADNSINRLDYDEKGNILEKSEDRAGDENVGDYMEHGDCFIGFDLGTSGARMSIVEKKLSPIDENIGAAKWYYREVLTEALAWDDNLQYDIAKDWRSAIDVLLSRAYGSEVMERVKAICVSGTSATCLLVNRESLTVSRGAARMYNFDILSSGTKSTIDAKGSKSKKKKASSPSERVMELIDEYVPEKHTARATTGSLAKLLLWNEESSLVDNETDEVQEVLCHQSDYVSMSLVHEGTDKKCTVTSDWHNCLKLGYDVQRREFPEWMHKLLKEGANISDPESVLPSRVISPGEPFGVISPRVATKYGLSSNVMLVGGTTDSNAAFFAAAGAKPEFGTAVTSLGSTLAMKQLSRKFVEDASRGVYSHRFPRFGGDEGENDRGDDEAWLIGGASNVGCAVLRKEGFSNDELSYLSADIDPDSDSPLSYYPLTKKGERFPVADSEKEPVLDPKPDSRREYLHAILQGIGDVERDGFRILGELGASPKMPKVVLSCGGGSKNDIWVAMRERRLRDICEDGEQVKVKRAENTEASYGAALLAAASFED